MPCPGLRSADLRGSSTSCTRPRGAAVPAMTATGSWVSPPPSSSKIKQKIPLLSLPRLKQSKKTLAAATLPSLPDNPTLLCFRRQNEQGYTSWATAYSPQAHRPTGLQAHRPTGPQAHRPHRPSDSQATQTPAIQPSNIGMIGRCGPPLWADVDHVLGGCGAGHRRMWSGS